MTTDLLNFSDKTVVIAEDEGMSLLHYERALTRAGFEVAGRTLSGQEAVTMALQLRPALILMDINLQGRINGLDAAEQILRHYLVCIVVISAYADEAHRTRAEQIGVYGYIFKPVTSTYLIAEVEKAYQQWQQAHGREPR